MSISVNYHNPKTVQWGGYSEPDSACWLRISEAPNQQVVVFFTSRDAAFAFVDSVKQALVSFNFVESDTIHEGEQFDLR
jgi:hypothetical protein